MTRACGRKRSGETLLTSSCVVPCCCCGRSGGKPDIGRYKAACNPLLLVGALLAASYTPRGDLEGSGPGGIRVPSGSTSGILRRIIPWW